MNDHGFRLLPALLAGLALAGLGIAPVAADLRGDHGDDEPPAEQPRAADEQATEVYKNMLRWSTASEVDNFGYDIYRGESEDGPFERVTSEPMLGAGTTDEQSYYEFADDTIDPYATYWYYVESISKQGVRERFTSIFRKKAKLPRPSADSEAGSEDGQGEPEQR